MKKVLHTARTPFGITLVVITLGISLFSYTVRKTVVRSSAASVSKTEISDTKAVTNQPEMISVSIEGLKLKQ